MNPVLESQQLIAAARKERARSCAFWGLNPADFDTHGPQTPTVALVQTKAVLARHNGGLARLRPRLWLSRLMRLTTRGRG